MPGEDVVHKGNALITRYLHIAHPEQLDDRTWASKYQQAIWLIGFERDLLNLEKDLKI